MGDYIRSGGRVAASTDDYDIWSSQQLAAYFERHGLGEYSKCLIQHKITGKLAPLLSDLDLKEMGINCIGDRLRFRSHIDQLKLQARAIARTKCIWEGQEQLYFSGISAACCTCCGLFPEDPSTYKLMSNHLKIKNVKPIRIGRLRLPCCNHYSINNVDLTYVADVDVIGVPAPCLERVLCCAPGKDILEVAIRTGGDGVGPSGTSYYKLVLSEGQGDQVAEMILNSIEESQLMDRS